MALEPTAESILSALSETPGQIARITRPRSELELRVAPTAGAWSALEILAHLRACADVWGAAIRGIISEDRPTIRYVSPRAWIKKTDYRDLSFRESLRAFSDQRAELIAVLGTLDEEGWSRSAVFTATTQRDATVLSYATRIAVHEVRHLGQLRRTIR